MHPLQEESSNFQSIYAEDQSLDRDARQHHYGQKARNILQSLVVREFEPEDRQQVQRIFCEGMMSMVTDTAFRGLRHHPESLLLYSAMAVICFIVTMCWWLIGLLPAIVLCGRYFYSRRVILGYLEQALSRDMGNIEEFYMKSPDTRLWVAVLEGKVVGVAAAVGQQKSKGVVELQRMSVDQNCRRCGVGAALGRKVLEFAVSCRYSNVVLGTTSYMPAVHRFYQCLGFRRVGVTNGYVKPGAGSSLLQRIFYRVRHHHYCLDVQYIKIRTDMSSSAG